MNFLTADEAQNVVAAINGIANLEKGLAELSIGNVPLYDCNGEVVGWISQNSGTWAFYPGEKAPEDG